MNISHIPQKGPPDAVLYAAPRAEGGSESRALLGIIDVANSLCRSEEGAELAKRIHWLNLSRAPSESSHGLEEGVKVGFRLSHQLSLQVQEQWGEYKIVDLGQLLEKASKEIEGCIERHLPREEILAYAQEQLEALGNKVSEFNRIMNSACDSGASFSMIEGVLDYINFCIHILGVTPSLCEPEEVAIALQESAALFAPLPATQGEVFSTITIHAIQRVAAASLEALKRTNDADIKAFQEGLQIGLNLAKGALETTSSAGAHLRKVVGSDDEVVVLKEEVDRIDAYMNRVLDSLREHRCLEEGYRDASEIGSVFYNTRGASDMLKARLEYLTS